MLAVDHWASLPNFYSAFQVQTLQCFLLLCGAFHKQVPCSAPLGWQANTPSENTSASPTKSVGSDWDCCGHHLSTTSTLLSHGGATGQCVRPDSCFLSSCHSPTAGIAAHLLFSRYTSAAHICL